MEAIFADYELTKPHPDPRILIRDACLAAGYDIVEATDLDPENHTCMLQAEEGTWGIISARRGARIIGNGVTITIIAD